MSSVRAATMADLDVVSALERSVFNLDAWSPRSVEEELRAMSPDRRVVVSVDGSDVVGYAVMTATGPTCDLRRIAVADTHRRRGLATRMLVDLVSASRSRGCDRMLLEVAADNVAGLGLYQRHGFEEVSRRTRYYRDLTDAVMMQRDLDRCVG